MRKWRRCLKRCVCMHTANCPPTMPLPLMHPSIQRRKCNTSDAHSTSTGSTTKAHVFLVKQVCALCCPPSSLPCPQHGVTRKMCTLLLCGMLCCSHHAWWWCLTAGQAWHGQCWCEGQVWGVDQGGEDVGKRSATKAIHGAGKQEGQNQRSHLVAAPHCHD